MGKSSKIDVVRAFTYQKKGGAVWCEESKKAGLQNLGCSYFVPAAPRGGGPGGAGERAT